MRPQLFFVLALACAALAGAQIGDMEFCSVVGTVTDQNGDPVAGIKVEIRFAQTTGTQDSEEFDREDDRPDENALNFTRDRAIFGWGVTDEDGRYEITGVRKPGAFMLIVRGQKKYRRIEAPISIDVAVGKEFVADLRLQRTADAIQPPTTSKVHEALDAAQAAERAGDTATAMAELEKASKMVPDSAIPSFHLARLVDPVSGADTPDQVCVLLDVRVPAFPFVLPVAHGENLAVRIR